MTRPLPAWPGSDMPEVFATGVMAALANLLHFAADPLYHDCISGHHETRASEDTFRGRCVDIIEGWPEPGAINGRCRCNSNISMMVRIASKEAA